MHRRFDLKTYLLYIVNFNIQPPYYYLVFYIQLLVVAPIFANWCRFVNSNKYKWVLHLGTLGFLGWFAYVSIRCTFILPVHGGGQFLGGGTYVILYYLGMVLMSNGVFSKSVKRRLIIVVFGFGLCIIWVWQMSKGILPFDVCMSPYWGDGFNPPSVNFMVYALIILFISYSVFSLVCEHNLFIVLRRFMNACSFIGRNTLYVWLYHLYVISFLANRFPSLGERNLLIRLLALIGIITFPVIVKQLLAEFKKVYSKHIYQICDK